MTKKTIFFLIITIVIVFNVAFFFFQKKKLVSVSDNDILQKITSNALRADCPVKVLEKIVNGESMSPIIKSGQNVKVIEGYYDCYDIQRGDVVEYDYKGNANPLIKRVLVLGGDEVKIVGDNLEVNGQILKNSSGQEYFLNKQNKQMLSLYIEDNGRLRADAYLIFGESQDESLDSRYFGAVGKSGFLGRFVID